MEGGSANMEARVIWRPGRLASSGGRLNNPQVGNSVFIATAEVRTVFRENSPFSAGHPVNPAGRVSFSCQKFFLGLPSPAAPRRNTKFGATPSHFFASIVSRNRKPCRSDLQLLHAANKAILSHNSIGSSTPVSTLLFCFFLHNQHFGYLYVDKACPWAEIPSGNCSYLSIRFPTTSTSYISRTWHFRVEPSLLEPFDKGYTCRKSLFWEAWLDALSWGRMVRRTKG